MGRNSGLIGFLAVAALMASSCDNLNELTAGRELYSQIMSARSLSSHYVEVTFDGPVGSKMGLAETYNIVEDGGSTPLHIRAARIVENESRAILTTDAQKELSYRLTVANPSQSATISAATFPGSTASEMKLGYAVALSNTTVLLTFSQVLETASANTSSNYTINDPDLAVTAAVRGAGTALGHTVTLTTGPQGDQLYTVRAVNVANSTNAILVDPDANTVAFYGIARTDVTAPRLLSAEAASPTTILLSFSEPLENFALDVTNYTVAFGGGTPLPVVGVQVNSWGTQALLSVFPMTPGTAYTTTVNNVEDRAGNVINPAFKTAAFVYTDLDDGDPESVLPRVSGAISTSNRTVLVTYNKPMSDMALVPSNYFIIQKNQQPEAGYLMVTDASFVGNGRTTVQLATLSQSELTYLLRVVNVEDMQGNQLQPPDLLVDPATAVFPGTPSTCRPACAAGSGKPNGNDGHGACSSDEDCDNDAPCNPAEADCDGKCHENCEFEDFDGDGLPDAEEQRGWKVEVQLATKRGDNGQRDTVLRDVTSNPLVADTDNDGLDDSLEKQLGADPRDQDTDDDLVLDEREYNLHFSNVLDQDSDNDDIDDHLEISYFFTSPIIDDTDGDQMSDADELFDRSRNPLIADLPLPQITVAEIALELKITSSFTDEEGTTTSISDTTSTTFTQSVTDTLGTSETNTTESENTFGQKIAAEGGTAGFKISGEVSFGQSLGQGFSSTVDQQSSETAQQEYQNSVTNALEQSQSRSVTRNIDEAIVQATVNISNNSDIAFSITNLELSLLQQDRVTGLSFRPIATMRPTSASDPTGQPVYNIAPLEQNRGPIIFENATVFPNRIDDLMREPTGLVFKVVNFDVSDEFGRNLVFTAQEVADRTVAITIDFGDGRVELYRVATASDFDENGLPSGITMERALEIAGILKDNTATADIAHTYKTVLDSRLDENNDPISVEALVRIRDIEKSADGRKFWTAVTNNTDLDENADFSSIVLQARDTILLMYTSDDDEDGLFLREEYLYGSDDTLDDTDEDTIPDFDEVRTGWLVARVPGLPYKTFPSPARPDSDLDGTRDDAEQFAKTDPNRADTDEDGRSDTSELKDTYDIVLFDADIDPSNNKVLKVAPYSDWAITAGPNGTCNTTVATGDDTLVTQNGTGSKLCLASGPNGIIDTVLVGDDKLVATAKIDPGPNGACDTTTATSDDVVEFSVAATPPAKGSIGKVCISAGLNDTLNTLPLGDDFVRVVHKGLFGTNPVSRDTDLDGVPDGREVILGINPNTKDAGNVIDSDGDGLFDKEEEDGWMVAGFGLVTSDKNVPDTDHDGIPDILERAIASHPNRLDTDGDTLLDYIEFDSANPAVNLAPMFNSVTLATALQKCSAADHCIYTAPVPGVLTRTNPALADSDGDLRADNIELTIPCVYTVYGGSATQVLSHPRFAESELSVNQIADGRNDGLECVSGGTNPLDPDTDDDLRNDGAEASAGLNPLRKDKKIKVKMLNIAINSEQDGATFQGVELLGQFQIRYPDTTEFEFYDNPCNGEQGVCDTSACCCQSCGGGASRSCAGEAIPVNVESATFTFQEGETFTLKSSELRDNDFTCGAISGNSIGTANEIIDFDVNLDLTPAVGVGGTAPNYSLTLNYLITVVN